MSNSPKLDIVYLVLEAQHLWGGVMNVFREAEALRRRGHRCQIICPTLQGDCYQDFDVPFHHVDHLSPQTIPEADLIIATYYGTISPAWKAERAGKGRAIHYCQGYEGDSADLFDYLSLIERSYLLPGIQHLTINNFLAHRCKALFGWEPSVIPYGIGPEFSEGPPPSEHQPLRIGLVGPWEIEWKDLPTGLQGIQRARTLGLDLSLVRLSPTPIPEDERKAWGDLQVEAHERLTPQEMGVLYRSMDLFVGSSRGGGEGFFLPALEAMRSGVPCLLSDISCFHSYADPSDYALFFPAGSPQGLADQILTLGNSLELRQTLRTRGLATAKGYSFDSHVDGLEDALLEISKTPSQIAGKAFDDWDLSEQALINEQKGDSPQAIALAQKALRGHPSSFALWEAIGRILGRAHRLEEARDALHQAHKIQPSSPATLGALAFCESQLGQLDQAADSYGKALDLGFPGPRPYLDLALVHMSRGDTPSAIQALKNAQKLMPRNGPHGKARKRIETEIAYLTALGKPECTF